MNREKHRTSSEARGLASQSNAQRIELLLKSLHGVQAARVEFDKQNKLIGVYVVPAGTASSKGLTRNVQSALMAAHGISLDARAVLIVPELPLKLAQDAVAPESDAAADSQRPAAQRRLAAIGKIGLPANGYRPIPHVELMELQRLSGDSLQCKVVIEMGGRRRTGVAEAGEEREGAVTLAARATLDALRFIEPGDWLFEGAADVIIAGQRHIVVSICRNEDVASVSGAAPVHESVEQAVANAVLNAAGLTTAVTSDNTRRVAQQR